MGQALTASKTTCRHRHSKPAHRTCSMLGGRRADTSHISAITSRPTPRQPPCTGTALHSPHPRAVRLTHPPTHLDALLQLRRLGVAAVRVHLGGQRRQPRRQPLVLLLPPLLLALVLYLALWWLRVQSRRGRGVSTEWREAARAPSHPTPAATIVVHRRHRSWPARAPRAPAPSHAHLPRRRAA